MEIFTRKFYKSNIHFHIHHGVKMKIADLNKKVFANLVKHLRRLNNSQETHVLNVPYFKERGEGRGWTSCLPRG